MSTGAFTPAQQVTIRRLERITGKLERQLGLTPEWQIDYVYDPGFDGDSALSEDGTTNVSTTTAVTVAQWQYGKAAIRWYLPVAANATELQLWRVAIHEFCHVLNSPAHAHMKSGGQVAEIEERAVENVTRAIENALRTDPAGAPA